MKSDFYDRIAMLLSVPYDRVLYKELYSIMRLVCEEASAGVTYSNFFSMLGVVCDRYHVPKSMAARLQSLRRRSNRMNDEVAEDLFVADARLLAEFVSIIQKKPVPEELKSLLPASCEVTTLPLRARRKFDLLRVRVVGVDGCRILAQVDSDVETDKVIIDCGGADGNLLYVAELVHEGTLLNLLKVKVMDDGAYVPECVVLEPDYLMSPSEVAGVFEIQGASPYNYFIRMFAPSEISLSLLLGAASGVFLDDLLAEAQTGDDDAASYAASMQKVFRQMPIEFSLFMADADNAQRFHHEAMAQFNNIRRLFKEEISTDRGFDLSESLLEPSFVCPQVGLAGRMDFLQGDGHKLIEQKSGKRDEFLCTHREPHYVQMMLYQMIIEHTMGIADRDCHAYLLYSHYADGLMREKPYRKLLYRAIEMRNRIVSMAERIANGELGDIMTAVEAEDLRINNISDKLWSVYVKPRLNVVLERFANCDKGSATYNYVIRFCTFLMKENWYAKMGNPVSGVHGYADLWNSPALVRSSNGEMFAGLTVRDVITSGNRVEVVVFALPEDICSGQSNFRPGDAVQFYSYKGNDANVSHQYTFRGKLTRLTPLEAEVTLANPQHKISLLQKSPDRRFAIEHDHVDSGNTVLCRSLFSFLGMPAGWQNSFLLTTMPQRGNVGLLHGNYGVFDDLVAQERASQEWFLVIGPPGSGKTSCALRYMVEEELRASSCTRLMLLAYTNRAVDELCGMLEDIVTDSPELLNDYLRLGHQVSASPEYRSRMIDSRVTHGCNKARDVRSLLDRVRVVVATVSTMSLQRALLSNYDFEVAFVDEASQILEPYILPIYTQGRIRRYVLVGDQKQLPAVVMQNSSDAAITDECLLQLGIHNCAESLFSRMLHRFMSQGRSDLYCQIKTQGRMHPDLFTFVNKTFYGKTLECVPLNHQKRSIEELYPVMPEAGLPLHNLARCLARNRVVFLDCQPEPDGINDKINRAEALMVADCVKALSELYFANNRRITPADIGVIVPYRNQISMIRTCLQKSGLNDFLNMTIDTVERYQGSQRNIIIYSLTVRHLSQLKFLTSSVYNEADGLYDRDYPVDRRLNVALTRAREQTIIVGNSHVLHQVPLFKKMIDMCRRWKCNKSV